MTQHSRRPNVQESTLTSLSSPGMAALLLDFDGIVIDTEWAEWNAWRTVSTARGVDPAVADYRQFIGRTDHVATLADRIVASSPHPVTRTAIIEAVHASLVQTTTELPVREGLLSVLATARGHGLRIAVVSNSATADISFHLTRLSLDEQVDVIVGSDQLERHKPHPEAYGTALRVLAIDKSQARAIEDSLPGVRSAIAAGVAVAFVPSPVAPRVTTPAGAQFFPNLSAIPNSWILGTDD